MGKLKLVTNENRRLKDEVNSFQGLGNGSSHHKGGVSSKERDKLKEALRTLKRVTVKQEVSLANLRQKSKQRRQEIDHKDKLIKKLENENQSYRKAHERMKIDGSDDDVASLKSKIADLQLRLANEETAKAAQTEILKEKEAGISSLQTMLATAKGRGVVRTKSADSNQMSTMSDSTSGDDIAKLKKELARKSEKITNLQHDLDIAKDEIHDLKQRNQFSNAFPSTPTPGELDFFEETGEGDDFWAAF